MSSLLACLALGVAAADYVSLGLAAYSADGETARLHVLSAAQGVVSAAAPASFAPSLAPCATAYVRAADARRWLGVAGDVLVVPAADGSAVTLLSAADGSVVASVPLTSPFLLPVLAFSAHDGLLYAVGTTPDPGPFLTLVSINATTGAVVPISPLLSDDVLECASGIDAASGVWAYSYTGPLQLQVLAGGAPDDASAGFSVAVDVGAVMGVAPATIGGRQLVLFLALDAQLALNALYALDVESLNVSALLPINASFVNPGQGALAFDASEGVAAALAQLSPGEGGGGVLLSFNLTGLTVEAAARRPRETEAGGRGDDGRLSFVRLDDAGSAVLGLWGLAVR